MQVTRRRGAHRLLSQVEGQTAHLVITQHAARRKVGGDNSTPRWEGHLNVGVEEEELGTGCHAHAILRVTTRKRRGRRAAAGLLVMTSHDPLKGGE